MSAFKLQQKRIIISGGGTGGHLFPALAIADALKNVEPECEILFVGALGKIEMEKVPQAGYPIIGLDIKGLQRSLSLENLKFPLRLIRSVYKSLQVIKEFKPHVVVGVGGYASGPLLYAAHMKGIPCLVQEQNSCPGITNKLLAKKASRVCVAYEGMEAFFPKEKLILTGNPVRPDILNIRDKREEALAFFNLSSELKTIFITGGSLGAKTLNESMLAGLPALKSAQVQVIWQCGKFYHEKLKSAFSHKEYPNIKLLQFISRVDLAYAAADIIIARAGAGTISEVCLVQKPVILVPSPNVTNDHQTKNALTIVNKGAAILIKDTDAPQELIPQALALMSDEQKKTELIREITKQGLSEAAVHIAKEVIALIKTD